MKKLFIVLFLILTGNLLSADEYLECLLRVERWLNGTYSADSIVYSALKKDLLKIVSGNQSNVEKIAAIKGLCPQAFILSDAERMYLAKAQAGDADAQFKLGESCLFGDGISPDLTQAVYWFRKAADQDHVVAQCTLGVCYYYGYGVPKNFSDAVYWLRKASEQGDAAAQNNLGGCYYSGNGVNKDLVKAVYWFQKSAEQGYATAQNNLGWCYYSGIGVAKDLTKALYWYSKAADQGHSEAKKAFRSLKDRASSR